MLCEYFRDIIMIIMLLGVGYVDIGAESRCREVYVNVQVLVAPHRLIFVENLHTHR